jgi:hypothetical protein
VTPRMFHLDFSPTDRPTDRLVPARVASSRII